MEATKRCAKPRCHRNPSARLAASEGYRVRRELFRNGRATSVELTDAVLELFRASLESVNARADLRSARARVLHASGRDVPPALAAR